MRGGDAESAVRHHRAAGRRRDGQPVGAGAQRFGLAEHAARAGDVDRLDAIERDQHDLLGRKRGFFVLAGQGGHSYAADIKSEGAASVRATVGADRFEYRDVGHRRLQPGSAAAARTDRPDAAAREQASVRRGVEAAPRWQAGRRDPRAERPHRDHRLPAAACGAAARRRRRRAGGRTAARRGDAVPGVRGRGRAGLRRLRPRPSGGADYIVVPAMEPDNDAAVTAWLRRQASLGARRHQRVPRRACPRTSRAARRPPLHRALVGSHDARSSATPAPATCRTSAT